jgi:D-sedoheptulose 7-phosphate isomerase
MQNYFNEYIKKTNEGLSKTIFQFNGKVISSDEGISLFADKVDKLKEENGKIFFAGNGASCTMAEHMSADFFKNAEINTVTSSETSYLTAVTNDLGGENIFSHRIKRIGEEKDILVAISSSGSSPNIVKAIEEAKGKGLFVVTLTGMKETNKAFSAGDLNIFVPLDKYGLIEAVHPLILHMLLDAYLDKYQGGRI